MTPRVTIRNKRQAVTNKTVTNNQPQIATPPPQGNTQASSCRWQRNPASERMPPHSQPPYRWSFFAILVAWFAGAILMMGFSHYDVLPFPPRLIWLVTIGSGMVGLAAGIPGVLGELTQRGDTSPGQITFGFSAGSLVRLFGTIALIALCRYHMPAATHEAAITILGWYCYLTTVDVVVLARLLPRGDRIDLNCGGGTDGDSRRP